MLYWILKAFVWLFYPCKYTNFFAHTELSRTAVPQPLAQLITLPAATIHYLKLYVYIFLSVKEQCLSADAMSSVFMVIHDNRRAVLE